MAVEWLRVDGPSPLTVHVFRDGQELVKEKAPEYLMRTEIMKDGSLKLSGVQRRDSGTYRCVLLSVSSGQEVTFVSLVVALASEVNLSVQRTSDNELLVHCESSGWSPKPLVSLLDSRRKNIHAAHKESSVRPDDVFSVRAFINMAAAEGNGTFICRVEIPEVNLAKENQISITDEFDPLQTGCGYCHKLVVAATLVAFAIVASVLLVKKRHLKVLCSSSITWEAEEQQAEYGDINMLDTIGASEITASTNQLNISGKEASYELARRDWDELLKYKMQIRNVGTKLGVQPALIAAIISRQSQAGINLNTTGYGQTDPNCFGLMQINKHYHAVKGGAFSEEHVDQGVTYLIQLIKTMRRTKRDWSKEQQLKAALACYIAGEDKVIPLRYEELDSVTVNGDFSNDVVARAQWFIRHGF
nr:butyrophilin subfamily 3 member A2-like isoform X2 [Scatophagus argus]XP_046236095.1 butyrophilin subfamily 3 member A2-like isoform X2 [Scatophagus argus]